MDTEVTFYQMGVDFVRNLVTGINSGMLYEALKPTHAEYHILAIRIKAFERATLNYKRARHIAHAAYGLRRKGSQGWRRG